MPSMHNHHIPICLLCHTHTRYEGKKKTSSSALIRSTWIRIPQSKSNAWNVFHANSMVICLHMLVVANKSSHFAFQFHHNVRSKSFRFLAPGGKKQFTRASGRCVSIPTNQMQFEAGNNDFQKLKIKIKKSLFYQILNMFFPCLSYVKTSTPTISPMGREQHISRTKRQNL